MRVRHATRGVLAGAGADQAMTSICHQVPLATDPGMSFAQDKRPNKLSMTDRWQEASPIIMASRSSTSPTPQSKPQKVSYRHTLERVRNNQRQHRARRKTYIETLEKKLAEAEQTVSALRSQLGALQAEHRQCHNRNVADCRTLPESWVHTHDQTSPASLRSTLGTGLRASGPLPEMTGAGTLSLPLPPPTTNFSISDDLSIGLPSSLGPRPERHSTTPTPLHGVEQAEQIPAVLETLEGIAVPQLSLGSISTSRSDYTPDLALAATSYQLAWRNASLPPATAMSVQLPASTKPGYSYDPRSNRQWKSEPMDQMAHIRNHENPFLMPDDAFQSAIEAYFEAGGDGESTMLCSEAYILISQQNFKGISQEDVVTWLRDGFRKSLQPGRGCRVKTDMLFSLLAFISEGW